MQAFHDVGFGSVGLIGADFEQEERVVELGSSLGRVDFRNSVNGGILGAVAGGQAEEQIVCYALTGFFNIHAITPLANNNTIIVVNTGK